MGLWQSKLVHIHLRDVESYYSNKMKIHFSIFTSSVNNFKLLLTTIFGCERRAKKKIPSADGYVKCGTGLRAKKTFWEENEMNFFFDTKWAKCTHQRRWNFFFCSPFYLSRSFSVAFSWTPRRLTFITFLQRLTNTLMWMAKEIFFFALEKLPNGISKMIRFIFAGSAPTTDHHKRRDWHF